MSDWVRRMVELSCNFSPQPMLVVIVFVRVTYKERITMLYGMVVYVVLTCC
jgi:hypothetical protein